MTQQVLDHQLQFDNDKFMITKRLFNEIYSQVNYIVDYAKCRLYVRRTLANSPTETKEVRAFEKKKIDIEL